METLRFAHRFFHFDRAAWDRALGSNQADWNFVRALFEDPRLPRRQLKRGEPRTFEEARKIHDRQCAEEQSLGIRALAEGDPGYPEAFIRYVPPERRPSLLYVRGPDIPQETKLVGVVGTRSPSLAGRDAAHSFGAYLAALGIPVVSGLARGIDTIAHEESLRPGTVAVLGAEVGRVYPEENQQLAERILGAGGTLASPFPSDQVPLPRNFPERNELIAALAAGVIVIEGAEKSGAAITGRHALAMGKAVVALAQDFRTSYGRGAIRLQQDGAVLVTREEEAIEAIFRRLGGYGGALFPTVDPPRRTFTFSEFQAAAGVGVAEALASLEEGILQGRIERWGAKFRLTRPAQKGQKGGQ